MLRMTVCQQRISRALGFGVFGIVLLAAAPVAAQVTTMGNVATGTGNLSGGVTNQGGTPDFTTPPVDTLNINSLTQDIAPAAGTAGVDFFGPSITLNVDTGAFEIVTDGAVGVSAVSPGNSSVQELTFNNVTIDTTGSDSSAITASGPGADSVATANVSNTSIVTRGDRSAGIDLDGVEPIRSAENTNFLNVDIRTEGADSDGLIARSAPFDTSTTVRTFDQIDITTTGDRSDGLVLGEQTASDRFGGAADMSSLTINVDQTTISTNGDESRGFVINGFGDGANNSDAGALVQNLAVTTQGENAVGVTLNTGSEGASNSLFTTAVDNVTVGTTGNGATGFILNSGTGRVSTGTSRFTTVIDNTSVTTSGDNADGIVLGPGLGEDDGNLPASPNPTNTVAVGTGVSATTSGANSHALVVSENTVLALLSAGNPDSRITNLDNVDATGSGSRAVQNNGTLQTGPTGEVFTNGTGVRGNIANSGTIEGSGANALVYDTAANSDDLFELQPGGVVNGNVLAGNGTDTFVLGGDGDDSFDHTLLGTQYQGFDEFVKEDSSTWTLTGTDSAAAFLPGTITGGTLIVNPVLSGFDVDVQVGATLAGMGGVRRANVAGIFTPGGFGTAANFSVAGDLTLQAGSITNIDILADGTSDLVTVDGTVTLAGSLGVNGVMFPSGFPLENEYTVLTSPNAIAGSFSTVFDNLPDVDAMVMVLAPTGPLDPDPNQPARVVVSYMRSADTSDKAILSNSAQFGGQMGLAFVETMQRRARLYRPCSHDGRSGWHEGIGGSHRATTAGATGYSGGYGGYAAGVERCVVASDGALRYGLAGAYTGGGLTSGVSEADLNGGQIGVYASLNMQSGLLISSALGYGFLDYDIDRRIPVAGGGAPMTATGNASGGVLAFSVAGSYDLAPYLGYSPAYGFRIAPIVRLDWLDARRGAFGETGMGILNLDVSAANFESGLVSYGLELGRRKITAGGLPINALFDIRYEHLVGDRNAGSTSVLQTVGGAPFTDPGTLERRDRVAMGIGAEAQVSKNVSVHGRYDTALRGNASSHRAAGGVTVRY